MRHPIDGFPIPAPAARVLEHLSRLEEAEYLEAWELQLRFASLLYDFSSDVLAAHTWPVPITEREACTELAYLTTPFELTPCSWNGGDGLHYDWVVHAPELQRTDFPMVSFAPLEDGAVWLGDNTAQGLAHLMVGNRKGRVELGQEDPLGGEEWETLVALLGHRPDPDDERIMAGARSELCCVPSVPAGYRFEEGPDGVGVLADASLFGDLDFEAMPGDQALFEREAARLAAEGKHAGALVLLKNLRSWEPDNPCVVEQMRNAYVALGRPMHAARAAGWLARRRLNAG